MKKLTALTLVLAMFISCIIVSFPSYAAGKTETKSASYIDKGGIVSIDTSYDKNFVSISSSDSNVATAALERASGKLVISGRSKGYAEITLRLGTSEDYTDYIYPVNVISVFSDVSFTYDYDKITVVYEASELPAGCTPVFSIDGKNWSESSTLTRDKENDGIIYKGYKVDGTVTGSYKTYYFDKKRSVSNDSKTSELTLAKGATQSIKDDLKTDEAIDDYQVGAISDEITFDKDSCVITAAKAGYAMLDIVTKKESDFAADGSYTINATSYHYSITITNEDGSTVSKWGSGSSSSSSSTGTSSGKSFGKHTWKYNGIGWWYEESNDTETTYPSNQWKYIGSIWYYFDSSGYMESGCYRNGCWLNDDGSYNSSYCNGGWKCNNFGWWYEDNGWYPTSQWLKIDGYWYYFLANGYMASNQYVDGYWLGSDGAWTP